MRLPPNFRLRCAVLDLVDGPRAGRIEVRGRRSIAGVLRTEPGVRRRTLYPLF